VGAQWVAWRLRGPAIVLMLGIGLLAGPLLGVLDPKAALGDLITPSYQSQLPSSCLRVA
jgi:NhaP-type Na+/H+ or K+/H+ antiporter